MGDRMRKFFFGGGGEILYIFPFPDISRGGEGNDLPKDSVIYSWLCFRQREEMGIVSIQITFQLSVREELSKRMEESAKEMSYLFSSF